MWAWGEQTTALRYKKCPSDQEKTFNRGMKSNKRNEESEFNLQAMYFAGRYRGLNRFKANL